MKLQQVLSYVRKAADDYSMIKEGDSIAVGISGGKDSLTLLYALHGLQRFYPARFELCAITVDLGFQNLNLEEIKALTGSLGIEYHIVQTDIAQIIFEDRKETNPCSLCAKMRKGALNDAIKKFGCNKVAYAHHKDGMFQFYGQIGVLERQLQGKGFFRCHKSYLVNLAYVQSYTRQELVLDHGEKIAIAKRRYHAFCRELLEYMKKNGGIF